MLIKCRYPLCRKLSHVKHHRFSNTQALQSSWPPKRAFALMSMRSIAESNEKKYSLSVCTTDWSTRDTAGPLPDSVPHMASTQLPRWSTDRHAGTARRLGGWGGDTVRERRPSTPPSSAARLLGIAFTLPFLSHIIPVAVSKKSGNVKELNTAFKTVFRRLAHSLQMQKIYYFLPFLERRQCSALKTSEWLNYWQ